LNTLLASVFLNRASHNRHETNPEKIMKSLFILSLTVLVTLALPAAEGVRYAAGKGPGQGRQIVFLSGDEEYRSEEGFPMLAKILAAKHGFNCTVLFTLIRPTARLTRIIRPT